MRESSFSAPPFPSKRNRKGKSKGKRERKREANHSYAGWIGTVGAAHEGVPHPTLEDAATRLAAIAGTSTCHIAQSKEGILVPGVVRLLFHFLSIISPPSRSVASPTRWFFSLRSQILPSLSFRLSLRSGLG
jgi:hypothetical protein